MPKFTVVSYDDTYKTPYVDHVEAEDADGAALEVAKARGDDDIGVVAVLDGHLQDRLGANYIQWTASLLEACLD